MTASNNNSSFFDETDADRRRGVLADNALFVDLVSAYAGDRALTEAEKKFMIDLKSSRGVGFYSDLFYSITHQYFCPEVAEALWIEVLGHKHLLLDALGRNV